jgi:hypothetical protein
VAAETLADTVHREAPPPGIPTAVVRLDAGDATIGVRRLGAGR